jgi:hypothetical protein
MVDLIAAGPGPAPGAGDEQQRVRRADPSLPAALERPRELRRRISWLNRSVSVDTLKAIAAPSVPSLDNRRGFFADDCSFDMLWGGT